LDQFAIDNPNYDSKLNEEWANECLENTNDSPLTGGDIARKRVADGTHHLLGGEIQRRLVADGTHHLLGGEIQGKASRKRVADGTHNLLKNKSTVPCYDREGNYVRVPKSVYDIDKQMNQNAADREYAFMTSKEAKKRITNHPKERPTE
jgi:hypothetical protein